MELCQAHIINSAFPNSSRVWTIQRKDVDNFYGSGFEADFVAIEYLEERNLGKVLPDKKLSKLLNAQILLEDRPIDFFVAKGKIPSQITPMEFDNGEKVTRFGLKISREEMLAAEGKPCDIAVNKDARIPAIVSLIKAAHLTLFQGTEYRQQIKTFRLKYIFFAEKIIRTARSVVMKLSEKYPYQEIYEQSLS